MAPGAACAAPKKEVSMIRCTVISEPQESKEMEKPSKVEGLRLGVLIPAYNESAHLPSVIRACRAVEPSVILVVDDASSDGTIDVLRQEEARCRTGTPLCWERCEVNLGKQGAVRRGLQALRPMDLDAVALLDGDGQHNPADLPRLCELVRQGYEIVIGLRDRGEMPLERQIANWLVNRCFAWVGGVDFGDVQSGLRLYNKQLADVLAERLPERGRYALEHESLAALAEYAREQGRDIPAAAAKIRCRYGVSKSNIAGQDVRRLVIETVRQALRLRLAAWESLAPELAR
jgi:glycosyltransferase involved in cell wall biosynthesis